MPTVADNIKACPYLWKRARDAEGNVITRDTQTTCCGAKALDVFECRHPARAPAAGGNDQVTLNDCHSCLWKPRQRHASARVLIFKNNLCPGDVLAMTAAIYSLHKANSGSFVTAVETTAPALWEHNPDVVSLEDAAGGEEVQMHYPLVNESNQRLIHFLQAYCDYLEHALKVRVPLLTNRPMIYLGRAEQEWVGQVEEVVGRRVPYWVMCAGRKNDYTAKFWGTENYQRVVDLLRGRIQFVQIGEQGHHHPPLKNVINLVGHTDHRQLVRLVHHADGVVCGVTYLHHLAAALEKPSVTIMGGREPVAWNTYPRCQLLHTVGSLSCCAHGGCWKSRTVALGDSSEQNNVLCDDPVLGDEPLPRCMTLIRPEEVAEKILLTKARF